ncbi:hypothetical protein PF010_g7999 [Phytophthora fragariae]|uniref:RxLR effector protein n=2 Tax=Phytophthora TaxID=4783 RepID=A0A6G0P9A6_9STRA|nr:hypothetical protein PR001_g18071 [Phytophthora rubi]KAE9017484.1 hypothetical protein PR002_g13374 [Phytophthora rubi]KAE9119052.1 hypothetical protein PF010_g7999 [Phytophthora fragariae]KAE9239960.1 hypothetical protein PF004_g7713 [Phytophthora fragariae]KAE9335272.1 hypothetical protein PR003_g13090 [Phytophthora rubi]
MSTCASLLLLAASRWSPSCASHQFRSISQKAHAAVHVHTRCAVPHSSVWPHAAHP